MTKPANANGHRRRQVVARVKAEETHCALCDEWVDQSLTIDWGKHSPRCTNPECAGCVPHPMSPVVDEIVPRARGGSPTDRANCQLAHWSCNRRKSDGTYTPIVVTPRALFPTSTAW